MTTDQAIQYFGSVAELARALGISVAAVYQWPETVPLRRQYQLERITAGALVACDPGAPVKSAGEAA